MLQKVVLLTWLLNWCFYHILQCNLEVYKQNPMDYIYSTLLELELHDLGQSVNIKQNKQTYRKMLEPVTVQNRAFSIHQSI